MPPISFATTNSHKLAAAKAVCKLFDIEVAGVSLMIDEIQSEDAKLIALDKAAKSFAAHRSPVVVVDDSWSIPALSGFPGPYMKSMNRWFGAAEWLRLMNGANDRSVMMQQYLVYQDTFQVKIFTSNIHGQFLHTAKGASKTMSSQAVIALDSDNGKSIAEVYASKADAAADRYVKRGDAWLAFAEWYRNHHASA